MKLPYAAAVGVVIALRRRQVGLTQRSLAAAIGVEQSIISKTEIGSNPLTVDRLHAVGTVLRDHFDLQLTARFRKQLEQFGDPRGDIAWVIAAGSNDRQRQRHTAAGLLADADLLLTHLAAEQVAEGLVISQRSMIELASVVLDKHPPAQKPSRAESKRTRT